MKKRLTLLACMAFSLLGLQAQTIDDIYHRFQRVPDEARTKVWWFHGENKTTREGITADLEAYKQAGVGGVVYYDQQHGPGTPDASPSMSPAWWEMLKFGAQEAKRLGLSFEINISNGYVCGGPWITPDLAIQAVYSKETLIAGGQHYHAPLPSPDRAHERDIAVLVFPVKKGYHETISCLQEGFTTLEPATVLLAAFDEPFTARSLSYKSNGYSKGPQSIMNIPCDPQDDFCGDSFQLLPPLGELEVSDDGVTWHKAVTLAPCYRMQSLRPNYTISFPAVTGRYFRLNLHDWDNGQPQELTIKSVELSAKAVTYRWEERAAYTTEYTRATKTPAYQGDEVIALDQLLDISHCMDSEGVLDWTAPEGSDWKVIRFVYAPTGARTKHGRKNLIGLECDKLSTRAAEIHWNNYAQVILDSLQTIGCRPTGVCMDSHEAGSQNWTHDFEQLFLQERGYDILPYLPAMQGYIVGSVEQTERFLQDLRRTIADGICHRYFATLQRLATEAKVDFTAQAMGNGQSICSDNLMAKCFIDRPQGEFWARMHDGAYDIKEAASAAHLFNRPIASAESFTDITYAHSLGSVKDEIDMATVFQVNELVVCASESQPWVYDGEKYRINTGYNRDYALNRCNTMWPFSKGFWDYQARNSYLMRQGKPVVDILVYAGDDAPMKLLGHRLPIIPEGFDFDVCTTYPIRGGEVIDGQLQMPHAALSYRVLAIEKLATLRPEMERKIAAWREQGLTVFDNRVQPDSAIFTCLKNIQPDLKLTSRKSATDRVVHTHRRTDDADIYFICNHSETRTFNREVVMRTDFEEAEWWDALDGSRRVLPVEKVDGGLRATLHLRPDEAGFLVARQKATEGLHRYDAHPEERIETLSGPWCVVFDTQLGGPTEPVRFDELTDWSLSRNPAIRYFSGLATYHKNIRIAKPRDGERVYLRMPGLEGVSKVWVNSHNAGLVWCTPWEAEITDYIKSGKNDLRIEVRNSLVNRLVGDEHLPEDERHTWIYTKLYNTESPLVPSGIVGSIEIVYR